MPHFFFRETKHAQEQITNLYDFVWPTAAAMWNLRWQLNGYLQVVPGATNDQLHARFTEGSQLHGANIRRACVEHSWEEQTEAFARVVLVNTIAIYEGWVEAVLKAMDKKNDTRVKALQFPAPRGAQSVIDQLTASQSDVLSTCVYPRLCNSRYYALHVIEPMLKCYRYFKEVRNCSMHGGGVANLKLVQAYAAFQPYATPHALGMNEVPVHSVPVEGSPVSLVLRGAVGFSQIVLKIMVTLDAEFSRSSASERAFVAKWKATHPTRELLPTAQPRRRNRMNWMMHNAGFPRPDNPELFTAWLIDKSLIAL